MPSFKVIGISLPEKTVFKGFYHIWAWRPLWSCDLDHLNKFSFPHPKEAPHEIQLQSAQWLLRKKKFKNIDSERF